MIGNGGRDTADETAKQVPARLSGGAAALYPPQPHKAIGTRRAPTA